MSSTKSVLFSFGEGGHSAQANRLAKLLLPMLSDFNIISISDVKKQPEWSDFHYVTGEVREKHSHLSLLSNKGPFEVFSTLNTIRSHHNIECVVSTGPGVSLLSAMFFKILGKKVIHVETWSRFHSKSLTGKLMYLVADKFYVQNKSLLEVYPKAIYSGLL